MRLDGIHHVTAITGDAQRTISQRTFERVRRIELQLGVEPSHYEPGGAPRAAGSKTEAPGGRPESEAPDREALEV